MRVVCRHGHIALFPSDRTDVLKFERIFKIDLFDVEDFYTFEGLSDLPRWSQIARPFGGLPATATFEGQNPWDVMRANDFVFSLTTETLVPRATVVTSAKIKQTLDCAFFPRPLIQPNALIAPGKWLIGYQGEIDLDFQRLYIYSQEVLSL